jgi:hypothetical protein
VERLDLGGQRLEVREAQIVDDQVPALGKRAHLLLGFGVELPFGQHLLEEWREEPGSSGVGHLVPGRQHGGQYMSAYFGYFPGTRR